NPLRLMSCICACLSRLRATFSYCLFFIFLFFFFFFTYSSTSEIYTLSLHDALPISGFFVLFLLIEFDTPFLKKFRVVSRFHDHRSEEHTSELQSRENLVCRLLLEKKNKFNALNIFSYVLFVLYKFYSP